MQKQDTPRANNYIQRQGKGIWRRTAPLGLMMVGLGFSFTGEAIIWKMQASPAWQWVLLGTLGLVVFNAGLSIFGDAVKRRTHEEWQQALDQNEAR